MNQEKIFNVRNIKTMASIAMVVMVISIIISLVQTPKYQSSAKLLIIYKQDNIDPYTATKTSEYITNILSEVIYSGSFVDNVFNSKFNLKNDLGINQETRQKNWRKMINNEVKADKGIITLRVLHREKNQASQFAQAIVYTITTKHQLYHGLGDKINIKIIDNPTTSESWAQPKIIYNALIGFVGGWIIGISIIILFPRQRILELLSYRTKKALIKDETIELVHADEEKNIPDNHQDFSTNWQPEIPTNDDENDPRQDW